MAVTVHWTLMFRVANQRAFDSCLDRTLPILGGHVAGEGKPYWKDPSLWECGVSVPLDGDAVAEQVLTCLVAACGVATGWQLTGSLTSESAEGFGGVFDIRQAGSKSSVVELEWAHFELIENRA